MEWAFWSEDGQMDCGWVGGGEGGRAWTSRHSGAEQPEPAFFSASLDCTISCLTMVK